MITIFTWLSLYMPKHYINEMSSWMAYFYHCGPKAQLLGSLWNITILLVYNRYIVDLIIYKPNEKRWTNNSGPVRHFHLLSRHKTWHMHCKFRSSHTRPLSTHNYTPPSRVLRISPWHTRCKCCSYHTRHLHIHP